MRLPLSTAPSQQAGKAAYLSPEGERIFISANKAKASAPMKLNEINDNKGARKGRMRVGRGIGFGQGQDRRTRPEGPDQPLGRLDQRI
jgi:hypothetical protein